VSRAFSRFHKRGLIDVKQKRVSILDHDGLAQTLESSGLITRAVPFRF